MNVLYYCLPNRRLAVVRDFKGIVLSFANHDVAVSYAQIVTAQQTYYLDYPIVVKTGFTWDNTTDGIDKNPQDTLQNEVYGYPLGKQPRGLYPIMQLGV